MIMSKIDIYLFIVVVICYSYVWQIRRYLQCIKHGKYGKHSSIRTIKIYEIYAAEEESLMSKNNGNDEVSFIKRCIITHSSSCIVEKEMRFRMWNKFILYSLGCFCWFLCISWAFIFWNIFSQLIWYLIQTIRYYKISS